MTLLSHSLNHSMCTVFCFNGKYSIYTQLFMLTTLQYFKYLLYITLLRCHGTSRHVCKYVANGKVYAGLLMKLSWGFACHVQTTATVFNIKPTEPVQHRQKQNWNEESLKGSIIWLYCSKDTNKYIFQTLQHKLGHLTKMAKTKKRILIIRKFTFVNPFQIWTAPRIFCFL